MYRAAKPKCSSRRQPDRPRVAVLANVKPLRRVRSLLAVGRGRSIMVFASADLMPEQPCSCVRRLNEKRGLTCLCCGRIDDIGAAVVIAGCDECRRQVITE